MIFYGHNDYRDYLAHHGIKGQRWGVRNGPPYPLGSIRKEKSYKAKIRSRNLDKWGADRDHNTLFITGLSGSGKSTLAINMAEKRNADVIHLDFYLSPMSEESRAEWQSKGFNSYLDKNVKGWKNVIKKDNTLNWKVVDEMAKASEEYSKLLYDKKKRLIIEGVQLLDNTFYSDRNHYKDSPFLLVDTSALKSLHRGNMRDDMKGLDRFYRIPNYLRTAKIKSELVKELALKGKQTYDFDNIY